MKNGTQIFCFCILMLSSACSAQYTSWERNKSINSIDFVKIRYGLEGKDTTVIIGLLRNRTNIDGYPCEKGWVHFNNDRELILFQLSEKAIINNFEFIKNTWIYVNDNKLTCVLPGDTVIQGYLCMGRGGVKGVQTSFYPNGRLESFFTEKAIQIGDIWCRGGYLNSVCLHENGQLRECTLSEAQLINKSEYKKGARICFDLDGQVINLYRLSPVFL